MFKEDIERTIGKVLKYNGYKLISLGKGCIYYIKRYSNKLGFYIRCTDNRHHNGGITIQMFFTAIQIPDDSITTLYQGLEIHILTIYGDITDEIMIGAGKKVIAIERNIGNMSDIILEEIKSPYFPQERSAIFKEIITIYDMINEDGDWQNEVIALKDKVFKAVKNKRHVEAFQLCSEFIDNLPTDYFQGKIFNMDINAIKNCFSEQLRAQCMFGI
ncbi:MAG: hypothetical protein K2N90_01660 [Lachnospiraceae bacterium]|nr:hypothetical protein [Lachnospiraceae bacterium]